VCNDPGGQVDSCGFYSGVAGFNNVLEGPLASGAMGQHGHGERVVLCLIREV
jgi:hypothetical protein